MDFFTVGVNYYKGYCLDIYVTEEMETLKGPLVKEYYKIINMESGTMQVQLNGNLYILTGVNALCLNETDDFLIIEMSELVASLLFFKPSVINNKFNFNTFKCLDSLSVSERQDFDYLSHFQESSNLSSKIIPLHTIDAAAIKQKLELLQEQLTFQNSSFWPCRSRSYLFEILFALVRPEEEKNSLLLNEIDSNFSKRTIDVIYYLQTCYNQKITMEQLAQVFHTNRTTLQIDFKKSTGQSINRYLTQLRMTMAAALLRDTELTINEICERTGFIDISYFSKTFKREIQFTPSEYRHINAREL